MTTITRRQSGPAEAERAAADALLLGYPLVLMDRLRGASPRNVLAHQRAVARSGPHVPLVQDTLASWGWLELAGGPVALTVPDCHGLYFTLSLVDMWARVFASIGPRTTGARGKAFAIVGPRSAGAALPASVFPIAAPTGSVLVSMQIQLDRSTRGRGAHDLQDGFGLHPVGRPAVGHFPAARRPLSPRDAAATVESMDPATFYAVLSELIDEHPPRPVDRILVERLRRAGVLAAPGARPTASPDALEAGMRRGLARLRTAAAPREEQQLGRWRIRYGDGPYRTDYAGRAAAARAGRFLTSAGDEVPAVVVDDADGEPLTGSRRYVLRFPADAPPPVQGFWSLGAYADVSPAGAPRCSARIGNADGLTMDLDGSLAIHIQAAPPAGREQRSNWLPSPRGTFGLVLRLFWPLADVLDGRWTPPSVVRVA